MIINFNYGEAKMTTSGISSNIEGPTAKVVQSKWRKSTIP